MTAQGGVTQTEGGETTAESEVVQTQSGAITQKDGNTQSEGIASTEEGGVILSDVSTVETEGVLKLTSEVVPICEAPAQVELNDVLAEFTAGNDVIKRELLATSVTKRRAQRSRLQDLGAMRTDENLLSQEMFISIEGNQFRRNGMGSFGTFLY